MAEKPSAALEGRNAVRHYIRDTKQGREVAQRLISDINGQLHSKLDRTNHTASIMTLNNGDLYHLSGRPRDLIAAAADVLPLDYPIHPTMLPGAAGFVWLERPVVTHWEKWPHPLSIRAMTWTITEKFGPEEIEQAVTIGDMRFATTAPSMEKVSDIVFGMWCETHHSPPILVFSASCLPGSSIQALQDADPDDSFLEGLRFIVAFLSFIDQRILVTERTHLDRAAQRRIEHSKQGIDPVSVITLRKAKRDTQDADAHARHAEWRYQWLVSGHWRKQPYPSLGITKTIWILPHRKGPDHLPMKPATERIFAVRR